MPMAPNSPDSALRNDRLRRDRATGSLSGVRQSHPGHLPAGVPHSQIGTRKGATRRPEPHNLKFTQRASPAAQGLEFSLRRHRSPPCYRVTTRRGDDRLSRAPIT